MIELYRIDYSGVLKPKGRKGFKLHYRCNRAVVYESKRYGKTLTVPKGFISDGATGVVDLQSLGWWVHDVACRFWKWDDGSKMTVTESSYILHDILKSEHRKVRAKVWGGATWVWQWMQRPFR